MPGNERRRRHHGIAGYVCTVPSALLLVAVYGVPTVALFYYATRDVDPSGRSTPVGLANLGALLDESHFHGNLMVTIAYLAGVLVLSVPAAYAAALVVTMPFRGVSVVRTLLLMPWVLAPVVTALLFRTLVDPAQGPVAAVASALAGHPVAPVSNGLGALVVVIVHAAWRSVPIEMLLLAAAMSGIRRELYEAVRVDGGGRIAELRYVTLPHTRTALVSACLVISVFTLHDAESVYALTRGGPGYDTESTAVRLLKEAFLYYDVGTGSAIGVVLVVLTVLVLVALRWLSRRAEAASS